MKQFVLNTKSESSDYYTYFIEHPQKPTAEEIVQFLDIHANDKEDGYVYEHVQSIIEIPKTFKKLK